MGVEVGEKAGAQVFAQKLCVDYVFGGDCRAVLYYADVKKRIELSIKESYEQSEEKLKKLLSEMREYLKQGMIPAIPKGQKCSGCSMKDLCMPTTRKQKPFRKMLNEIRTMEV